MKVKFKHPPINELIIGVYFDSPIQKFRSEHIGLLWSKLRDRLPKVEQKEPILTALHPELTISNEQDFMLPRFLFVSEDSANLIQVQRDAFIHNWRRTDSEYPHYSKQVKPNFDQYYDIFESFILEEVKDSRPRIMVCELTYVNVIEACAYFKGPQDTANVIPSLAESLRGFGDEPATAIDNACLFILNSGIQLHVAVRTAHSIEGPDADRLVIEFRARGHVGGNLETRHRIMVF